MERLLLQPEEEEEQHLQRLAVELWILSAIFLQLVFPGCRTIYVRGAAPAAAGGGGGAAPAAAGGGGGAPDAPGGGAGNLVSSHLSPPREPGGSGNAFHIRGAAPAATGGGGGAPEAPGGGAEDLLSTDSCFRARQFQDRVLRTRSSTCSTWRWWWGGACSSWGRRRSGPGCSRRWRGSSTGCRRWWWRGARGARRRSWRSS